MFAFSLGLALVVNGEITVGVMGCPNWTNDTIVDEKDGRATGSNSRGILMVSHVGCGTWSRHLSGEIGQFTKAQDIWKRCFVDSCSVVLLWTLSSARFISARNQSEIESQPDYVI
jgi:3'(2'), 5'-bisphosphate nucleotidase